MFLKSAAFALLALGLTACVTTPMPINHSPVDYAAQEPLRFDVAEVLVINDASMSDATRELTQYGQPPEAALREWAARRITGVGTQGSYSIIIRDANFVKTQLPVQGGIGNWMKRQQAERWDAYLNVLISVEGSANMLPPAEITLSVRSSQTLPEKASAEERRQTYASILNKLMSLFDAEAQKQMDAYFRAYYH